MSSLTRCNHCSLEDMKRRAKARGVEVIVGRERLGNQKEAWYTARYSDQDEPCAWFMQLTVGCAC